MMAIESVRYNGWANYPTWAVNLWLDNDEGWDWSSFPTADSLKEYIEESAVELVGSAGMFNVLGWALEFVDYDEIIRVHMEDRDVVGAVLSDTDIESLHPGAEYTSDSAVVRGHLLGFSNAYLLTIDIDRADVESVYIVRDTLGKRTALYAKGGSIAGDFIRVK